MSGNEKLCKKIFKNLYIQNVFAFIDLFYRYHYICYFIYWDCMWRHVCTICTEAATGGVLKNFANFTGKHLCWSHFLIKLQAWGSATLLKRDSNTDVFLWNKQNFTNTYFKEHLQTTADQMICNKILEKIRALLWI